MKGSQQASSPKRTEGTTPQAPSVFYGTQTEDASAGNPEYCAILRAEGIIGEFFFGSQYIDGPILLPMNLANYRQGINLTLIGAIKRLLTEKGHNLDANDTCATEHATALTNACMIATYLRLRMIHFFKPEREHKFSRKPKVADNIEVPAPFALAISHLGYMKMSSLPKIFTVAPTMETADAASFGLGTNRWCAQKYSEAVIFAKSLGMQFAPVDFSVKVGSSWWLYEQVEENDNF